MKNIYKRRENGSVVSNKMKTKESPLVTLTSGVLDVGGGLVV